MSINLLTIFWPFWSIFADFIRYCFNYEGNGSGDVHIKLQGGFDVVDRNDDVENRNDPKYFFGAVDSITITTCDNEPPKKKGGISAVLGIIDYFFRDNNDT